MAFAGIGSLFTVPGRRTMKKLPISVSMISGAEAGRIGRALESVREWTSEIIVVLNEEVRDGTEEIALRHGAKVFRGPWRGYKAQKNSAAAKATLESAKLRGGHTCHDDDKCGSHEDLELHASFRAVSP